MVSQLTDTMVVQGVAKCFDRYGAMQNLTLSLAHILHL